jgi:hypothetical protein
MNKLKLSDTCKILAVLLAIFIAGCGPKVTHCVVDFPIRKAHCRDLDSDKKFDKPIEQMEKYSCLSPDDWAELMRGSGKNATLCTIRSAKEAGDVYCNTVNGPVLTTLEGIHKFACYTADDLAELIRYVAKKKKG